MTRGLKCENRAPNGECYIGTIERCPKLRDFLFMDNEIMGEFFVECETLQEAWEIIYQEYGQNSNIEYTGMTFTPAEAEAIGYDTL